MKLYYFPVAPNPTRVRLYIQEKVDQGREQGVDLPDDLGLAYQVVSLPEGEQKKPEHLARNPMGNLPVLEMDDGSFLTESVAIVEYLEERFPEPNLYGETAEARARSRQLDRIADVGALFSIGIEVHATRSPLGLPPRPEVAELFRELGEKPLAFLDDVLSRQPFLGGERPIFADCTLASALQFGRFGKVALPQGLEHIERWDADFRARASAKAVLVV